jgi:hypothetical protein
MSYTPNYPTGMPARSSAIYQTVLTRLSQEEGGIEESVFINEYSFAISRLLTQFPCISDPAVLSGADAQFFDKAVSLIVAARFSSAAIAGTTIISTATADGTKESYTPPDANTPVKWITEGMEAVARVACVLSGYQSSLSKFSLYGLAGRTRNLEAQGVYPSLLAFGLGILDTGAFPLLGYVGTDYFRNGDYFLVGNTI